MIFVTVGTQKFQLNRLLKILDDERQDEKIFAQIGFSTYKPKNFKYKNFLTQKEFSEYIKKASIVITHAGVGSILTAMEYGKPILVFPRLKKYGEHVDDHQLQIAEKFMEKKYLMMYSEEKKLIDQINEAKNMKRNQYISSNDKYIKFLNQYISESENDKKRF